MAAISIEILESLSDVIRHFHTALKKVGIEGIKSDLANCKWANPFGLGVICTKWDEILYLLDKLAITLKKGNIDDVINITKDMSKCITNIQLVILNSVAEVGSFVPGPIGIVCSLALSISCFAVGDVTGGILNLIGAIPGAKFAKYFPVETLKSIVLRFKRTLITQFKIGISALSPVFTPNRYLLRVKFDDSFINTIEASKNKLSKIGDEINNIKEKINLAPKDSDNLLGQIVRNGDEWAHEYKYIPYGSYY